MMSFYRLPSEPDPWDPPWDPIDEQHDPACDCPPCADERALGLDADAASDLYDYED